MIKALTPGWPRGCWRVVLALVLGGVWPLIALAQQTDGSRNQSSKGAASKSGDAKGKEAEAGKDEPPKDEAPKGPTVGDRDEDEKKKAVVETSKAGKKTAEPVEVWKDPNADAALKVFKQLPSPGRGLNKAEMTEINNMASHQANLNPAAIKRYIDANAADLTRPDTLKLLADPNADLKKKDGPIRDWQRAARNLVQPLVAANNARYAQFRTEYTRLLIPVAREMLKNNLFARLEAMVALSQSTDPQAIPVYIEVLRDPNQVLCAKERAAVGLYLLAQGGRTEIDGNQAKEASRALVHLLENEPNAGWLVQAQALKALGALRLSTSELRSARTDFASVALRFLADPKAKPDVRAAAAWALGLMRANPGNGKYNFALIGYHVGQDAVDLGNRVIAVDAEGKEYRAKQYTELMLELLEAVNGDPDIQNAGLLRSNHPNLAPSRGFLEALDRNIRAVAQGSLDVFANVGRLRKAKREELQAKVNELKAFLAKNPPSEWALFPGGPEFRGAQPQVAAGGQAKP